MSAAAIEIFRKFPSPRISGQLSLGVDRVMTEGSLYDRELRSGSPSSRRAAT